MSSRSENGPAGRRLDRVVSLPLIRLFYPDPDPTEKYPGESADIEGYVMAPDRTITVAATAKTPGGIEMVDSVWAALQSKGVGRRRILLLDDRGRTVFVLTLDLKASNDILPVLRSLLVVPVHATSGFAEVHFLATTEEIDALERRIEKDGEPLPRSPKVTLPRAKETGVVRPEDWAFLGLLSSVGAFDGPEGPTPQLVAELIGLDPDAFAEQAAAVERGLGNLVTDIFAPPETGEEPAGPAS